MSEALPGVLEQIADELGVDAAHKVAMAFGGQRLWIGPNPASDSKLARVIGLDAARRLGRAVGPGEVEIPKGPARRDRRARALLAEGRLSHSEIAEAVGLTVRQIENHASRLRENRQLAMDLPPPVDRRARRG